MGSVNPCQVLAGPVSNAQPGPLSRFMSFWRERRSGHRVNVELGSLADLSEHTLNDFNAPCWMYLQAKSQRGAERQRLEALRMGVNQFW